METIDNKLALVQYDTLKFFQKVKNRNDLKYIADEYIKLMIKYTRSRVPLFSFAVFIDGFIENGTITIEDKHKFLYALLDTGYEEFANTIKVQLTDIEIVKESTIE